MYATPSSTPVSNTCTTAGCFRRAALRASRNRCEVPPRTDRPARGIFNATTRFKTVSCAFHTVPNPPAPNRSINSKRPRRGANSRSSTAVSSGRSVPETRSKRCATAIPRPTVREAAQNGPHAEPRTDSPRSSPLDLIAKRLRTDLPTDQPVVSCSASNSPAPQHLWTSRSTGISYSQKNRQIKSSAGHPDR